MAYVIKNSRNQTITTIADGSIDNTTNITLMGRNYVGYGLPLNENLVYLLENFASASAPKRPLLGMMWYDTSTGDFKVYNGTGPFSGFDYAVKTANSLTVNTTLGVTGNANVGNLGTTSIVMSAGNITNANVMFANTFTSNVATGTAPFTVSSTTRVNNLNVATAGSLINGTSNITIVQNAAINISSAGTANVFTVNNYGANVTGSANVTGEVLIGGNANISTNVNVTGNVTANLISGTLRTAAQPNITSVGTLTSLNTLGLITANVTTGIPSFSATHIALENPNATAGTSTIGFHFGGVSQASIRGNSTGNLYLNSNSNVFSFNTDAGSGTFVLQSIGNTFATVTNNTAIAFVGNVSTSANVTGANLIANTALYAPLINSGNSNITLTSNANVSIYVAGNATARAVFTSTGANIDGTANITGNANTGNLGTGNLVVITAANIPLVRNGNSNVSITANGSVTITATSNATMLITPTGANITGTANVSGNANIGNIGTGTIIATTAANVPLIQNGNSNIAITTNSNITITANNTAMLTVTNTGANIAGTGNITGAVSVGSLTTSGDISAANLTLSGTFNAAGLQNGNSNIAVAANSNVSISVTSTPNIVVVSTGGVNIAGYASVVGTVVANNYTVTGNATGNANVSAVTGNLGFRSIFATYTDNSAAASATIANAAVHAIAAPNLSAANSSVTFANAATFYIAGAPTANTNATITNAYAFMVGAGNVYFAGAANIAGNANVGNIGTATMIATTANLTTINSSLLQNGNSNVAITNNANVTINSTGNATLVVTGTGANIAGTANITGNANTGNLGTGTIIATTANLTTINSGLVKNGTSNVTIASNGNVNVFVGGNTTPRVTITGTAANIASLLNVTGNITTTGGSFVGDASGLTNVPIGTTIVNGNSNVVIPSSNGNVNINSVGNTTMVITGTGANITGTANITGNANVGNLGTGGLIVATGNITGGNLTTAGQLVSSLATGTAPLVVTSTTRVTNLNVATAGSVVNGNSNVVIPTANGNVSINAVGNTTMVITGTGANITGTANITGNANVGNIGATTVVATNVNASSNVNATTAINSPAYVNGNSSVNIAANSNVGISVAGNANVVVVTGTGANIAGTANITGNTSVGNLNTTGANGIVSANSLTTFGNMYGNPNIAFGLSGSFGFRALSANFFDNVAAASSTVANAAVHGINVPTLNSSNTAVTYTNAASFYILGSPQNSTNTTITNPYALMVDSGGGGGKVWFTGTDAATSTTTGVLRVGGGVGIGGNIYVGGGANITGTVTVSSDILPTANNFSNIGSPTQRFNKLYLAGATIDLAGQTISSTATGFNLSAINSTPIGNDTPSTGAFTTLSATGNANVGNIGTTTAIITTGNITTVNTGLLQNGTSNIRIASSGNIAITSNAAANVMVISNLGANISGTANISGNLSAGNVSATLLTGTLTTASQPNVTSLGTLNTLSVSGAAATSTTTGALQVTGGAGISGNIYVGGLISGDGGLLSNISVGGGSYIINGTSNVNVQPSGNVIVTINNTTGLTVAGNSTAVFKNWSTGSNVTAGTLTGSFTLTAGSALSATYADVAERYLADEVYEPGTVVKLGGTQEITICSEDCSDEVFGCISTAPAFILNTDNDDPHYLPVVLIGRSYINVLGTCSKGDRLVSAGNGAARKGSKAELTYRTEIGRALEDKNYQEMGLIEAYMSTK